MRVPPAPSLKLSADELLRDVRQRLAEKHPEVEAQLDATHPAWLLLQESAWMVEAFSRQLDRYPWSVVQQLAHLMGARLRPAQPAIGVVTVEAGEHGTLDLTDQPARWRFFAPRTETRDLVEFSIAEPNVPVAKGRFSGATRVHEAELHRAIGGERTTRAGFGGLERSAAFHAETFTWTMFASAGERVQDLLTGAVERMLTERHISWLRFSSRTQDERVHLTATIDVNAAFRDLPAVTPGGDIQVAWGTCDDSNWTPDVRIGRNPMLARTLRGSRPLAGDQPNTLLIPDVPAGVDTAALFERDARPAPASLVEAIWQTLVHLESGLAPLRPTAVRGVVLPPGEPAWVDSALRGGAWSTVVDRAEMSLATLELDVSTEPIPVRVAWAGVEGRLRAFPLHPEGLSASPLPQQPIWSERFPNPAGALQRVRVIQFEVPPGATGVLLVADGAATTVFLNPVLVLNAPVVRDGRRITVSRSIPEPVHLLYKDLVTRPILDRLCDGGLDRSTAALLGRLPLALSTSEEQRVEDFVGVHLDPTDGLMVVNAPDDQGVIASLRRGSQLALTWYRRTDAELANLSPGAISLIEQGPTVRPRLVGVSQPLATLHGNPRETEDAAIQRVFGPATPLPVTPGDWERLIRQDLGPRARTWLVRVWGYSERALISTALWPPEAVGGDPETHALRDQLAQAGPEVLLVAIGPSRAALDPKDLAWVRTVVEGLVSRWRDRVPTIQRALVTPLWGLELESEQELTLPAHTVRGLTGTLVDSVGRRAPVPRVTLLLNAAIVERHHA